MILFAQFLHLRSGQLHFAGHVSSRQIVFNGLEQVLLLLRTGSLFQKHCQGGLGCFSPAAGAWCEFDLVPEMEERD